MISRNKLKQLMFLVSLLAGLSYCLAQTSSLENEVRRLELDIPSLYLINGIFFSADQTRQLARLLAESAAIHEKNQRAIRQFLSAHQNDIDALLDQLLAGKKEEKQQAPPLTRARQAGQLHKVREEWQELINRSQHSFDELARKTSAMLTPAQRDILDRFVPCFIPPGDFRNPERVGQAGGDTSLGENMLARLRRVPPEKLNEAIERALDGLVPYIMKEQHAELTKPQIDELRDELRPPLKELTTYVRSMNDSDFELEKTALARQFLSLQNAAADNKGLDNLTKIKRYLLNPGVVSAIAKRAGDPAADFKPEVTPFTVLEEVKQKNKTFRAAILINTLQLTAGQARQLLPCIQKAAAARSEITREESAIFPQALKAYALLKKELENQQNTPQAEQEANKYHHRLKMLYEEKLAKTILESQDEMDQLLSADQVAFLIGRQSGNKRQAKKDITMVRGRARELFDAVDKMNDKEFAGNARNLCAGFVEFCVSSGAIDPDVIDSKAETERAQQVLTRGRQMRRSEYLKARDDLIAEICPRRSKPRAAMFGWKKSMGDQLEIVEPSTDLLLSQTGLTLLENKIKMGD